MITPRETRLLRAPTLGAFQRAIAEAVAGCGAASPAAAGLTSTRAATYGSSTSSDTTHAAAVLTPTREATLQLRRTLDAAGVDSGRAALVTRDEWYDWLRDRMGPGPPLLTPVEREVVAGAAAADAAAAGSAPPFRLRPGIVAALLAFYDQLRRRRRSVDAFERLLVEELEPSAELDRGARRLLLQTRFLVAAFRAYDRRLDALGGLDEHRLRERLLAADGIAAVSEIVVTVPDRVAHAAGLYAADFDLLARLPRLARVTLIATDAVLDSGYRERLEDLLPGLVERRVEPAPRRAPAIVVPDAGGDRPYFVWRDREEELRAIARRVRRAVAAGARPPASAAVVVRRPLPYVYLAPSVCGALDLPVRTGDALPLAVEPYAAAVDLVLAFAAGRFRRGPAVELLRSPHFAFDTGEAPPSAAAIRALDAALAEIGFAGGLEPLQACAAEWEAATGVRRTALAALRCVVALAGELRPLLAPRPLGAQLATLRAFLERHAPAGEAAADEAEADEAAADEAAADEAAADEADEAAADEAAADADEADADEADADEADEAGAGAGEAGDLVVRGRTRVRRGLEALEAAERELNQSGRDVDVDGVAPVVRRWIESRTLPPPAPSEGLQLVDVHAAAYGRFDDVFVAGLVETDWPAGTGRNIFYPAGLLAGLGWPRERDRQRASRAAFRDLLGLAAERVWLSAFSLEDDVVVTASPLLEDVESMDLERVPRRNRPPATRRRASRRSAPRRTCAAAGGSCARRGRRVRTPATGGRAGRPAASRNVRTRSAPWSATRRVRSSTSPGTRWVWRPSARRSRP